MDAVSQFQHLIDVTFFYGQMTNLFLLIITILNQIIELIFNIIMAVLIIYLELELQTVSTYFILLFWAIYINYLCLQTEDKDKENVEFVSKQVSKSFIFILLQNCIHLEKLNIFEVHLFSMYYIFVLFLKVILEETVPRDNRISTLTKTSN